MPKQISCGLLMYFHKDDEIKYFLVHPGGPFFKKKDEGYWSIPKGLQEDKEDKLETAKREFEEETGIIPKGDFLQLGSVIQKNNKEVFAWAFNCSNDKPVEIKSNTFNIEWPPKSGKIKTFPEVDRGEFFTEKVALAKINKAQTELIYRLKKILI